VVRFGLKFHQLGVRNSHCNILPEFGETGLGILSNISAAQDATARSSIDHWKSSNTHDREILCRLIQLNVSKSITWYRNSSDKSLPLLLLIMFTKLTSSLVYQLG